MLPVPPQFYYYPYWASTPQYFTSPQSYYPYPFPQGAAMPPPQPAAALPFGIPGQQMPTPTPPAATPGAQMPGPSPMYNMGYFMQAPQTSPIDYKQYLLQMKQQLADQMKKIDELLSALDKEEK